MTTINNNIYDFPNLGCLLGRAYQHQLTLLANTLTGNRLDISPAEYLVLRTLYAKGAQQQCEIWRTLGKDKASVCRTVNALAKKGMVNIDPINYKCSMVSLTASGEALRDKVYSAAETVHKALVANIGENGGEMLMQILTKLIN